MKHIKVIYSRPKATFVPFAWIVMIYMWRWFSHVSISYTDEETGLEMIAEASHGEVHLMERNHWLKHNHVVRVRHMSLHQDEYIGMMVYIYRMLQKPYGLLQNFGTVIYDITGFSFFDNGEGRFNCSEFVARAIPGQVSKIAKKPTDYIKPDGLYDLMFPGG